MSSVVQILSRTKRGINNNFTTPQEESEEPDSTTTTTEKEEEMPPLVVGFCVGQDVLLKQKDGRYYLGTVVEVDGIREQCLLKFGDNTSSWSGYKDLTKLSTPEQEDDLLCVVCKKSAPKSKQEIVVCDKCSRGYHQKCHQPEVPIECLKEGSLWKCKRCCTADYHGPQRLRRSDQAKILRRESLRSTTSSSSDTQVATSSCNKVFGYDLEALNWDTYHRVNTEQIYCYCGGTGEWYRQMLQCSRCRQWFHENCLDCLQYPLYCGDRFYVFVCAVCNHGNEFLRRLEVKWVDLVHLMLFNLTVYHSKKYYDLDSVIIPYINDNWHALQLSPKISNVSKTERRENILSILTNNRNRFKCGREIKKRTSIWGLRVRLPPPAPFMNLPSNGFITEEQLRILWQGHRRLQFLASDATKQTTATAKIVTNDSHMRIIMMGTAYQQTSALSDSDSPSCPSPELLLTDGNVVSSRVVDYPNLIKPEYIGAGCVKKSVPFPKMSLQRRKRLLSLNHQERRRALRKTKRRDDKKVDRAPYITRLSLDNSNNNNKNNNCESLPPLTPPTSVSAPPTPPASSSTNLISSDLSNDYSESCTNNKLELNTPCDTSGDETSSKSTLDLIIPPPKDFEGKNNPFLTLLKGGNAAQTAHTTKEDITLVGGVEIIGKKGRNNNNNNSKDSTVITLPLPLTAVIPGKPVMRPKKRQLSEKDIFIGPNGEVKRRRMRRNHRLNSFSGSTTTASKTAAVVPARPNSDWKGTQNNDYTFNGRRLRQRPDKEQQKEKNVTTNSNNATTTTTPKPSPVKKEPDIDIDNLKSSVNSYFGAANRIATGERFCVKAKRVGPIGKMEYLIEWEGATSNPIMMMMT